MAKLCPFLTCLSLLIQVSVRNFLTYQLVLE